MPNTESPPVSGETTVPATSVGSKLANVFVSPTEVFDELKNSPPQPANWLVPLICNIVVGIIFTMVVFSQPPIIQQLRQPMEERFQKMVKEHKMTQKQADQTLAAVDRFYNPGFLKAMGIVQSFLISPPVLFLFAFLLWLVARLAFNTPLDYMKAVEAVGLATMISVLGKVVAIPLVIIYQSLYVNNIGPVLLISHFDPANPLHVAIGALNPIWFWNLALLGLALARLTGRSFIKAAAYPFGCAALWVCLCVAIVKVMALFQGK